MKEYAIEVQQLSKVFKIKSTQGKDREKDFHALENINFSIEKEKTFGIIGKNGSGKSTLLRILAGVTGPSEGLVKTKGRVAAVLKIGSGFHPDLSGRENIYFYGSMMGMRRREIDEKFDTIVDFSEQREFIDEPIKNYSDGMYLRLAFSVVVHSGVDIILFDEVLAVGDNAFNIKSFSKIRELKKEKTIILVSHNMDDIVKICDECLWIDDGQIKSLGSPSLVVSQYMESSWLTSRNRELSIHGGKYFFGINQYNDDCSIFLKNAEIKQGSKERICDGGISYNENFVVSLRVSIYKDYPKGVFPSILIFNHNEVPIVVSSSLFAGDDKMRLYQRGNYELDCFIDKQILNIGIYKIQIFIFDYEENILLKKEDSVIFKIVSEIPKQKEVLIKSSFSVSASFDWKFKVI